MTLHFIWLIDRPLQFVLKVVHKSNTRKKEKKRKSPPFKRGVNKSRDSQCENGSILK